MSTVVEVNTSANPAFFTLPDGVSLTAIKTSSYQAVAGDLVRCDPTGGAFPVLLPAAPAKDDVVAVKNQSASASAITITPGAGHTIDGAATLVINFARGAYTVQFDGTSDWMVTA